ncbi:hypothetical protein [Flindersiella endophytica]
MNTPIEDRVRDLLADRTAEVSPPADWEERVVSAGRRRRVRRRAGAIGGVAIAVALVVLASGTSLPQALRGFDPARPSDTGSTRINPDRLPQGAPTERLYATGKFEGPSTVVAGDTTWTARERVGTLLPAGDGVVVGLRWDEEKLVYHRSDGSEKVLQSPANAVGVAVSADGKRVAWMDSRDDGDRLGYLRLAELPSGRIIRSTPVAVSALPKQGTPRVAAFFGDRVVLMYESVQSPYAWDPASNRIEPLLGTSYAGKQGQLVAARAPDTVLLRDAKGCVHNLRPADPRPVERWKECGLSPEPLTDVRISPDGRWFAGLQPDSGRIWVRELATGQLQWMDDLGPRVSEDRKLQRTVSELRFSQLAWESSGELLLTYGTPGDLDGEIADLLRCAADRPACERVPTATGDRVTRLAE